MKELIDRKSCSSFHPENPDSHRGGNSISYSPHPSCPPFYPENPDPDSYSNPLNKGNPLVMCQKRVVG
jgi:hypothetical protein